MLRFPVSIATIMYRPFSLTAISVQLVSRPDVPRFKDSHGNSAFDVAVSV